MKITNPVFFLLSFGYFTLSLSVALHEVTASPSAADLNEIEALALFYRPKLSIMAVEEINIEYAARNVPLNSVVISRYMTPKIRGLFYVINSYFLVAEIGYRAKKNWRCAKVWVKYK